LYQIKNDKLKMAKEIERKFLVTSDEWKENAQGTLYRQGYLSIERKRTVRVRFEGEKGKITIKGEKKKGEGDEFEYEIPGDEAAYMIEHLCLKPTIEKMRYKINYKGSTWEVDEFFGENSGLILAEIELKSVDQKFEKPKWIGKDVTEDPRYKNANLVKKPFVEW
jgi:adenylate cyclase